VTAGAETAVAAPEETAAGETVARNRRRPNKTVVVGLIAMVALGGLVGWLGIRLHGYHRDDAERAEYLQVGRQGALNLTTIDYEHAEADIQRVLDSSTGGFYDDFKNRSNAFLEVVQKAQAKSVGTVTEAGIESIDADGATVLVGVNVETTNLGSKDKTPRTWRMRVSVSRVGGEVKVSDVAFVP